MGQYNFVRKIYIFIIVLCFCSNVFATQQGNTYIIDNFSKGLNTKLSEYSLDKTQGTVVENIRFNEKLGSLSKREQHLLFGSADTTEAITGMHRLYLNDSTKKLIVTHGDEVESGNDATGAFTSILDLLSSGYKFDAETWHNLAILTDGYNQPIKTDGTDATYLGTCFAEDAGSGAGPDGTYLYKVTFYTTSYEVSLGVASNSVTVTDNDIDLSMIPIGPDTYLGEDVTGRKIYRTSDGGSDYKLLTNGTIANNTAVTLTDSDADGARGAALSPTTTHVVPTAKFAVIHNNRLFLACNPTDSKFSRVYYSDSGSHDYFPILNYIDIRLNDGDKITILENFLGRLCIGKENTIQYYYTDGDDPTSDWEVSDPFAHIGARAPYSVVNVPNLGLVFLSGDGLYKFTGQSADLISEAITPEIFDISASNLVNCWGAASNNLYYMTYTSEREGATSNNKMIVFDILADSYSIDLVDYSALEVFNSGDDNEIIYAGSSTDGAVYTFGLSNVGMVHVKQSDFSGTWDDMRYVPSGVPGGDTENASLEIGWDCTIDGWLTELQAKDASISTINDIVTYLADAIIDRSDGGGTYISQVLDLNIDEFDKIYWNERIPATGGDITVAIRTGATEAACEVATWSSEYTTPSGSDISALTVNRYVQYRVTMTATDIDYSPEMYSSGGYTLKITYNREGSSSETSVPLKWTSGWIDMGAPNNIKNLQKLITYHEGTSGTLTVTFENFIGTENEFTINLAENPKTYEEYFNGGMLSGEMFKITIFNNDLIPFNFDKLIITYEIEESTF